MSGLAVSSYTPSDEDILNPERGFRSWAELLEDEDFHTYRDLKGNTLIHAYVRLDKYRSCDIPTDLLTDLNAAFGRVREAGIKVVLRFSYNDGPYPDSEPDASKDWVLRHITQVEPVLRENADVIAWLEAGFIGAWGEWHTSTNGLDNPIDRREIYNALIDALPASRMVMLRYPQDIRTLYPNPLTQEQAFTGSPQARTAHHNDCFLASDDDWGTYPDPETIADDKAYLSQIGRFTPIGGETCNPNPPRSSCATALQEMEMLHFTEINEDYHEQVIAGWKMGGCYDDIRIRLGYRLTMLSASFERNLSQGGRLRLTGSLENSGFAAPVNPRPFFAVLDGPARYELPLTADPRRWEAGPIELDEQVNLPDDIIPGTYRLSLWLPDDSASLRSDPRYAIHFANENMWDETGGVNILGEVIVNTWTIHIPEIRNRPEE